MRVTYDPEADPLTIRTGYARYSAGHSEIACGHVKWNCVVKVHLFVVDIDYGVVGRDHLSAS